MAYAYATKERMTTEIIAAKGFTIFEVLGPIVVHALWQLATQCPRHARRSIYAAAAYTYCCRFCVEVKLLLLKDPLCVLKV